MNGLFFIRTGIITFCISLCVQSCGLHYTPDLSVEDFTMQRRLVLESQLKKDYSTLGKSYKSLTYGDPIAIKPLSYKRLDSLFQKKYSAKNLGQSTVELDLQIDQQQQVIQNDTNKLRYLETHWFELIQDTLHEFITAECVITQKNELDEMRILDYFTTLQKDTTLARRFCKEDPFVSNLSNYDLYSGQYNNVQRNAELDFYQLMKEKSMQLSGEEKEKFMQHVFQLMTISKEIQSLKTLKLVIQIARNKLEKENPKIDFTELIFEVSDQKDEFEIGYIEVLIIKSPEKSAFKIIKYNAWLEEIETR